MWNRRRGRPRLVASLKVIRSLTTEEEGANLAEDGMVVGAEVKG